MLKEEETTIVEGLPDLIADQLVTTLGNNTWLWLQALYESWMWPLSQTRHLPYPFKRRMSSSHKVSLMKRIVAYHRKNARLSSADDRCLFRPVYGLSETEKSAVQNKLKAVSESLEEAYKRQENISINELLLPFKQKDQWFCQDLFAYLLKNPLSFFDFLQVPQDATLSENPFRQGISQEDFLKATEEVGKYLPYNTKGSKEDFTHFYSWLKEHFQTLNAYSHQLEWEMHDKSYPLDSMPFSKWLENVSSQLLEVNSRWSNRLVIWTDITSIRDFMASWMDPDFQFPTFNDFANITITRQSLEILDDFACQHFNKPVKEMACWDVLRRPTLYLLARLYQEGFFKNLSTSSTTHAFETKTGLNTFEKKSLEDLCQEMVRKMNPYVFNQAHNGHKYKTFWFLEEWPEYKRMFAARIRPDELLEAFQSKKAISLPSDKSLEEAIYDRFASDGASVETMEQLAKELIPIPKGLKESYKEQGQHLTQVFLNKVLDYAQAEGINVEELRATRHNGKTIEDDCEIPLLSDLPPEKLDSWEDFRQALQECAFSRAKALQYFKDYELPDKQADLIKRTDKRLLEVWGDKEKWQRDFAKYASEDWVSQVQLEDAIKRIEKSLEADFGRSLHGKSLFQGLLAMGVENHNRVEHLPELSGLNRDDVLSKLAGLKRVQHSIKPDELARRKVETYDKDYLKLKHSLEDIYYGKSIAPEDSASLRSRVGHLLAVYIITCYPEFPEHLPSKEKSAHKFKHYDPEYILQCIEKRLDLHVAPGLFTHQQRYKQILMTLRAPSEAYNLTEDEQWSYIVSEMNRQYPQKDPSWPGDSKILQVPTNIQSGISLNASEKAVWELLTQKQHPSWVTIEEIHEANSKQQFSKPRDGSNRVSESTIRNWIRGLKIKGRHVETHRQGLKWRKK